MPTETTAAPTTSLDLHLDTEEVRQELALVDPEDLGTGSEVDPELENRAEEIASKLIGWEPDDTSAEDQARAAV